MPENLSSILEANGADRVHHGLGAPAWPLWHAGGCITLLGGKTPRMGLSRGLRTIRAWDFRLKEGT
jgi:hypothetical protein